MNIDNMCSRYDIEKPREIVSDVVKIDSKVFDKDLFSITGNERTPKNRVMQALNKIGSIKERLLYLEKLHHSLRESFTDFSGVQAIELSKFVSKEIEEYEAQKYNQKKERLFQHGIIQYRNQEKNLYDRFEDIKAGRLSELEMLKFIERLTDQHDIEKLKALKEDVEFYIFYAKEEREAEVSREEIQEAIDRRAKKGMEIPYYKRPTWNPSKLGCEITVLDSDKKILSFYNPPLIDEKPEFIERASAGKALINGFESSKIIDVEKLIFPTEFFLLYKFKNLVVKKLFEAEGSKSKSVNSKKPNKNQLARSYFTDFVNQLLEGKFKTSKDVVQALKEIEPEFQTVGDKQRSY